MLSGITDRQPLMVAPVLVKLFFRVTVPPYLHSFTSSVLWTGRPPILPPLPWRVTVCVCASYIGYSVLSPLTVNALTGFFPFSFVLQPLKAYLLPTSPCPVPYSIVKVRLYPASITPRYCRCLLSPSHHGETSTRPSRNRFRLVAPRSSAGLEITKPSH